MEEIQPEQIVDDTGQPTRLAASVNARYFGEVAAAFDLGGRVALLERDGRGHVGLSRTEVEALAPSVDCFLNQYGRATWLLPMIPGCRVYWDTDPGYTQVWQEAYDVDMGLRDHDMYLTVGLGLGRTRVPAADGRRLLGDDAVAGRAVGLDHEPARGRHVHHHRRLARVRCGRVRRCLVRAEGRRVQTDHRATSPNRRTHRALPRDPSGGPGSPRARSTWLARDPGEAPSWDPRGLSRLRPRLTGRVHLREGHVCRGAGRLDR